MPRFHFRLKNLLSLRQATRDQCRVQLSESLEAQRRLAARRAHLEHELDKQREVLRSNTAPGPLDVCRLTSAHRYDLAVRRELNALADQERILEAEIDLRREALLAADREVRALEKLRERRQDEFQHDQSLAETKRLDEIATQSFDRDS